MSANEIEHLLQEKCMSCNLFASSKEIEYFMFKNFIVCLLLIITTSIAKDNQLKDLSIYKTVKDVYQLLKDKKVSSFNTKYINKKIGIYVVYRIGMYDNVKHLDKISLIPNQGDIYPSYLSIQNTITKLPEHIKYKKVTFSCDTEEWSDKGFFIYKIDKTNILSNTQNYKYNTDILQVEKDLYHFVNIINDISFYMKYINGRRYIVILDEVSSDCSA